MGAGLILEYSNTTSALAANVVLKYAAHLMTPTAARRLCLSVFVCGFILPSPAAILGTNPPALPLTVERIAALTAAQEPAWREYLVRSEKQARADRDFLRDEMREHGVKEPTVPPAGHSAKSLPLDNRAAWYAGAEAARIADIVISFQTPAGGWSKNLDLTRHRRAPGEHFAAENLSRFASAGDLDAPHDAGWNYVGTFDNDATITELRFLAKVIAAAGPDKSAAGRASFTRGLDYTLAAQYPNGGWPQVWPLQGGYHDMITLNDDAMINILNLLREISTGQDEFAFITQSQRDRAAAAVARGVQCLLAAQIAVDGRRTVWCQQHDPLTLQPASARNYEMPAQTSSESAEVMLFLMQLPQPSPEVCAAVRAAAAWFRKTELRDIAYKPARGDGRHLLAAPGGGPLWARYYEIGSDRPVFGDRDKTIHDNVDEISRERRDGYGWYRDTPKRALEHFAGWSKKHP